MIVFLKRHIISIGLLILSSTVGLIVFMKVTPLDIWRIEYEFDSTLVSELPKFAQVDTVFQFKKNLCRNYTGSIADTLVDNGIRRYELKVYLPQPSEDRVIKLGKDLLSSPNIHVINHRFRETQRDKRGFLYWVLLGFFLGIVVEFVLSLKKNPRTD